MCVRTSFGKMYMQSGQVSFCPLILRFPFSDTFAFRVSSEMVPNATISMNANGMKILESRYFRCFLLFNFSKFLNFYFVNFRIQLVKCFFSWVDVYLERSASIDLEVLYASAFLGKSDKQFLLYSLIILQIPKIR